MGYTLLKSFALVEGAVAEIEKIKKNYWPTWCPQRRTQPRRVSEEAYQTSKEAQAIRGKRSREDWQEACRKARADLKIVGKALPKKGTDYYLRCKQIQSDIQQRRSDEVANA